MPGVLWPWFSTVFVWSLSNNRDGDIWLVLKRLFDKLHFCSVHLRLTKFSTSTLLKKRARGFRLILHVSSLMGPCVSGTVSRWLPFSKTTDLNMLIKQWITYNQLIASSLLAYSRKTPHELIKIFVDHALHVARIQLWTVQLVQQALL